jgi:hypothetical protein
MVHWILKDYTSTLGKSTGDRIIQLREEMTHYLEKARYPYLETYKQKDTSDLILDGWSTVEDMREMVLAKIMTENQN